MMGDAQRRGNKMAEVTPYFYLRPSTNVAWSAFNEHVNFLASYKYIICTLQVILCIPPLVQKDEEEDGDAVVEIEGLGWKLSSRRSPHLTVDQAVTVVKCSLK
jgi:hypothetical protein